MTNRILRAALAKSVATKSRLASSLWRTSNWGTQGLYMRWSGRQKESKWWRIVVFIWYGRTALRARRAVAAGMQRATPGSKQLLELKSNLAFLLAAAHFRRLLRLSKINVVKFGGEKVESNLVNFLGIVKSLLSLVCSLTLLDLTELTTLQKY